MYGLDKINKIALSMCPPAKQLISVDSSRFEIVNRLDGNDLRGIELGVAGGYFSQKMIESDRFGLFFGVDLYEDHHDVSEYKRALCLCGLESRYKLLRMSFDDALSLFPDSYFDFIYFDGYAHTGEEGGKTFLDWWPKLKCGGIMAGDDYHKDWPLVIWAVNNLANQCGAQLQVNSKVQRSHQNLYPTWSFKKPSGISEIRRDDRLIALGSLIRELTRARNEVDSDERNKVFNILAQEFEGMSKTS